MDYMGRDGFVWWNGVVEDINDPLKLGRCRVRIFGFYSGDKSLVPIDALPWAYPMQPINSASIGGIGISPTGLLNGSHVFGFFRDGMDAQQPVMLGSFGGVPQEEPDTTQGFNDPDGKYPDKETIKEQDTNRLARNEKIEGTIVQLKNDSLDEEIPIALNEDTWSEPKSPYDATYPHNHVRNSTSGHVIEIDDTPEKERLHVYHTSGSFQEVHPDGSKVEKIVKDNYEIVLGDDNVHISGDVNIMVGGDESNINILVTKDANIQVGGDANMTVDGNATAVIEKNLNAEAKKNVNVTAHEILALKGTQAVGIYSGGGIFMQDIDEGTFDLRSTNGNVDWTMKGDLNINATGQVTIRGGKGIDLNP
jgi:hypothetical protein